MILAVAATEFEMNPLLDALGEEPCCTLLSGVGPVESCLRLTRYLENASDTISVVVNFGVAGAFISERTMEQPELLDICIAETEVFGEMGIGKQCKGYIKQVREDGKLDVGLTKVGYAKVDALAERILQSLKQNQGFLPLHDKSTPQQIAKILKTSKANFKKSIGQLYRKKLIIIEDNGIRINE